MIDTINLKLSNVSRYPLTKLAFEKTGKQGQTVFEVNEDTGEVKETSHYRALLHHDTSNIIPLTKRDTMYVPSSHYTLSYKYNIVNDCVDFDFSIPKYLYGTNVLQFVKFFGQDAETQYQALMSFINGFIKKISFEPISALDLSITRLDICYNQFFNNKYDALKYLNEQKELLPKYARSTKNDYRSYESSLSYITKRYSFKIYHKGTEFEKNDRQKLADNNPTGETIDTLQDAADRILRYEITFRKAQIDYLFRERQLYNPYISFFFNENTRKSFRALQPRFYARILKFCERGHNYLCCPIAQNEAIDSGSVFFSQTVFNELYTFFWDYVKKYQLTCKMSVVDVMKRIDYKNDERDAITDKKLRKKNSFNKSFLTVLALLTQSYSLDDLRKSRLLPSTTFFKYQKQLKELGYTSHGKLVDIPPPSMDYLDYLYIFGHHHRK